MSRMSRRAARRARFETEADVDVTPFMNLMIVLVPVLLLSLAFTRTTILELNMPEASAATEAATPPSEQLRLEVWIYGDELVLADAGRGVLQRLDTDPEAGPDFAGLAAALVDIKARVPEHEQITLLLDPDVPYELLIATMDHVRVFPEGLTLSEAGEVTETTPAPGEQPQPLFPRIALGDAPVRDGSVASAGGD